MKKLLTLLILIGIFSCSPPRYLYFDPHSSRHDRMWRNDIDDLYFALPRGYFNYWNWANPYYRPSIVIPRVAPRPQQPRIIYQNTPPNSPQQSQPPIRNNNNAPIREFKKQENNQ